MRYQRNTLCAIIVGIFVIQTLRWAACLDRFVFLLSAVEVVVAVYLEGFTRSEGVLGDTTLAAFQVVFESLLVVFLNVVIEWEVADFSVEDVIVVNGFINSESAVVPDLGGLWVDGFANLVDDLLLCGCEVISFVASLILQQFIHVEFWKFVGVLAAGVIFPVLVG